MTVIAWFPHFWGCSMDYNGSQLAHLLSLIWTENSHILLEGFVSSG